MIFALPTDEQSLTDAIAHVTGMLDKKRAIWTHAFPVFDNFDIATDFRLSPHQFGLAMCALKLNRLKMCFARCSDTPASFLEDSDAEDSLVDLAAYAILTLGLLKRHRARQRFLTDPDAPELSLVKLLVDQYLQMTRGRAETDTLAPDMLGDPSPQSDPTTQQAANRHLSDPGVQHLLSHTFSNTSDLDDTPLTLSDLEMSDDQ